MNTPLTSRSPQHFLFMLPESATPDEQEQVLTAAKELAPRGYVYIASPQQRSMEDRDNIRFMPLKEHRLPCFGSLAGVMVLRDRHLALAAQEAYPGAEVKMMEPSRASEEEYHLAGLPAPLTGGAHPLSSSKTEVRLPQAA